MSRHEQFGGGGEKGPEQEAEIIDINVARACKEVEAMGGPEVLKEKIANASDRTKEALGLLLKGTPLAFMVFAAIGIAPAELGSLLGKWTQDSVGNPNPMGYKEALEFGAYASAALGVAGASMVAAIGARSSFRNFAEKMRLGRIKREAKV